MKIRFALLVTALALFALAPTASAATYKFSIKLKRDEEISGTAGTISFKVKTNKKGVAKKVTGMKVSGLKSLCLSEDGVKPGPTAEGKVKGSFKIKTFKLNGKTTYYFQKSGVKLGNFVASINGNVNKKGTKVTTVRVDGGDVDPKPPSCTARGDGKGKKK